MVSHQWTANHVTVGPQPAEMTISTNCGLWSCRTVVSFKKADLVQNTYSNMAASEKSIRDGSISVLFISDAWEVT